jgi:hypothetical protein
MKVALNTIHQPTKQEPVFSTSYVVVFFSMFNQLRRDVIVSFVDIGGIVDTV